MARRAQHDTQYWVEHIAKQHSSGLSIREYCERENLQVHHFYYYRKRVTTGEPAKLERQVIANQTRRAPSTSQSPVTKSTSDNHSQLDHGRAVVIRIGDYAVVQVPATTLATIEAVLKMAMAIGDQESHPSQSAFRSVIVRSQHSRISGHVISVARAFATSDF